MTAPSSGANNKTAKARTAKKNIQKPAELPAVQPSVDCTKINEPQNPPKTTAKSDQNMYTKFSTPSQCGRSIAVPQKQPTKLLKLSLSKMAPKSTTAKIVVDKYKSIASTSSIMPLSMETIKRDVLKAYNQG